MKKCINKTLKLIAIFLIFILPLSLPACNKTDVIEQGYYAYYINSSYTALVSEALPINAQISLDDMIARLQTTSTMDGKQAPLSGVSVLSTNITDGLLTMEFGREYTTLKGLKEMLTRAAIVKTLVQIDGVERIIFKVGNEYLKDGHGDNIGAMDATSFVDYSSKELTALISDELALYYVAPDGVSLIKETSTAYFDGTLSREQAVIKYMQYMPATVGAKAAISSNTNIINVQTNNGTCYLDMDMSFHDQNSDIPQSLSIMAIVNSLCELEGVRTVQINIIDASLENQPDQSLNPSGTYRADYSLVQE